VNYSEEYSDDHQKEDGENSVFICCQLDFGGSELNSPADFGVLGGRRLTLNL
jgi:hypothetical protein